MSECSSIVSDVRVINLSELLENCQLREVANLLNYIEEFKVSK